MAIFPFIEVGETEQVNDKLRISAVKSYAGKDEASAITDVEIEPEAGAGFISVFSSKVSDWYLDWEYATDGDKVISCRVTTDGSPVTSTKTIAILTEDDDYLFSTDDDLFRSETDILNYVPKGRNTFKYAHRYTQIQILEDLYRIGITDSDGNKLTKAAVVDIDEVRQWSRFLTLELIFLDVSNAIDDIFQQKSAIYKSWALESRQKAIMKLDINGDGDLDSRDGVDITWRRLDRV